MQVSSSFVVEDPEFVHLLSSLPSKPHDLGEALCKEKLMKFEKTPLAGGFVVDLEKRGDDRGFFARCFCTHEMKEQGINPTVSQVNLSFNETAGTLRGLHYQAAPYEEAKLVRCTRGAIFDVMVDIREESPTYLQWFGAKLTADNRKALLVPEGFAHGYQTLEENSEVLYLVSAHYEPSAGRGYLFDDPAIGIEWPMTPVNLSEQDGKWPCLP